METKGKLIVIEGGDGAGKATQTDLLVHRLVQDGVTTGTLDFPRFKTNTFGALIRECLDGKRGDYMHLDARVAATLFAADRFESKHILDEWLDEGRMVIMDRYTSANMIHQGSRLDSAEERQEFFNWLEHIEYNVFKLPKPDLVIYLRMPTIERLKLLEHAARQRENVIDVAESNPTHQETTAMIADELAESRPDWRVLECMRDGQLRSREDIHEELYTIVKDFLT